MAQRVIGGNLETVIPQFRLRRAANAELFDSAYHAKTRHVGPNEKGCQALHALATTLHERLRESRDDAGAMPIADPDLLAVQSPA